MKKLLITLLLVSSTATAQVWSDLQLNDSSAQFDRNITFTYNKQTGFIISFDTWIKTDRRMVRATVYCDGHRIEFYEKGVFVNSIQIDPGTAMWWNLRNYGCNIRP